MGPSHDPHYPLFPVFSFLGFIVCCIPLPWHIQAWNSGTCAYMVWTAVACLVEFVNCIVWAGNVDNPAPVWCDISSKIILGASVGIPAASLCISRRLYYLTSCQSASITREDKRRMVIVDLCIAVGGPAIIMILHYVVQGHRFNILEDIGCYPAVYNTLPAYFLVFVWPVIFGIISFTFSALTLRSFWIRRAQFNQLMTSNSSMSMARYFRLVLLSVLDILCTLPLGIYSIYIGTKGIDIAPWISWEDTHYHFSNVVLIPSLLWRSDSSTVISVELTRWLPVVCAFSFFAIFGFASEAQKQYNKVFQSVIKLFGIRPASAASAKGSTKISFRGWKKSLNSGKSSINSLPEYTPKSPSSYNHHPHSVELEFSSYSTFDVEKSAGLSSVLSETLTITTSRAHFKSPSSPTSNDFTPTSPTGTLHESHFVQTDPSSLCKPITQFPRSEEQETNDHSRPQNNPPSIYTVHSPTYPEVYLASDDADTFTISTFSYYGGAPSPSSPSQRFDLTHSTRTSQPQGLSPPPLCPIVKRPIPRHVPSSVDSVMTVSPSSPSSPVPLPLVEESPRMRTGDFAGGILVTVQKQSSVDKMV